MFEVFTIHFNTCYQMCCHCWTAYAWWHGLALHTQ